MPETEPWTPGELARGIKTALSTLERIETKMEQRPTRDEIARAEAAQLRKDTEQDAAISALESQFNKLLFLAVTSAISAVVSLVGPLITR